VMAQVDRDLTTVDYFDQLLGLIKNLGRHSGCHHPSHDELHLQLSLHCTEFTCRTRSPPT
jgi:hypothetical protein